MPSGDQTIFAYMWIFVPGRAPMEVRVALGPDRTIRAAFDNVVASRRGTDDEVPMDRVIELDGVRRRVTLNWEISLPVAPDHSLVVFDGESDASVRRAMVDKMSGYDMLVVPPDETASKFGLPDGVLIMVADWSPLSSIEAPREG